MKKTDTVTVPVTDSLTLEAGLPTERRDDWPSMVTGTDEDTIKVLVPGLRHDAVVVVNGGAGVVGLSNTDSPPTTGP